MQVGQKIRTKPISYVTKKEKESGKGTVFFEFEDGAVFNSELEEIAGKEFYIADIIGDRIVIVYNDEEWWIKESFIDEVIE